MTKPEISIITINYNNANGLTETFESVFKQNFKDFEYIIVDGGSTDGSKDVLALNSDKITYQISEKDKGVYNAQNKGIEKAQGNYIIFLNSGDCFKNKNSLKVLVENSEGKDIVYGDIIYKNGHEEIRVESPEILNLDFFIKSTLPHPCTLIKRTLFDKLGLYKEDVSICADWVFFIDAIAKHNASYKHVKEDIAVFLMGGISSKPESQLLIEAEKQFHLKTNYSFFLDQYLLLKDYENKMDLLKKSRILQLVRKIFPGYLKHIFPLFSFVFL